MRYLSAVARHARRRKVHSFGSLAEAVTIMSRQSNVMRFAMTFYLRIRRRRAKYEWRRDFLQKETIVIVYDL
jgi:hypothetical protein